MSLPERPGDWGPSHQYTPPPWRRRRARLALLAIVVLVWLSLVNQGCAAGLGAAAIDYANSTILHWAVELGVLAMLVWAWREGWLTALWRYARPWLYPIASRLPALSSRGGGQLAAPPADGPTLAAQARERCLRLGGGAYLGVGEQGAWVCADPEHAAMVLGPPRSGKTSAVVIPSILAAPGPVVCTSSKPDAMDVTRAARAEVGETWLFDPSGAREPWPDGVRRLCWSPVPAAKTWDQALLMARAMTAAGESAKGTTNEHHWRERSTALLAPLLHAASITDGQIADVLTWVLRDELAEAREALGDHGAQMACDVLAGIEKTDERERSSIFSATAGVLAAYNADSTRRNAAHPNFDADRFVRSCDTVYVTAPAHEQALCAPLVVGLLEQIRHAAYRQAAASTERREAPVYMCLDEVANIAPIHDLPALVSEAGGQGLHVLVCLQDLSQARKRWGEQAADGFLSLFQTKLILDGIADPKTLEAISLALGEYDRQIVAHNTGHSQPSKLLLPRFTDNENASYQTQRQRVLGPGDIAALPSGRALYLQGVRWTLIRTTPWHATEPWRHMGDTRQFI